MKQPAVSPPGPGNSSRNFPSIRREGLRLERGAEPGWPWRGGGMLAALGTQPSAACVSGCTVTCAGYSPRGVPEHNSGLFKPKQASKQGTRALCLQPPGCRRAFFPHLAATCTRSGVERKPPPPLHPPPSYFNKSCSMQETPDLYSLAASSVAVNQTFQSGVRRWSGGVFSIYLHLFTTWQGETADKGWKSIFSFSCSTQRPLMTQLSCSLLSDCYFLLSPQSFLLQFLNKGIVFLFQFSLKSPAGATC